MSITLPLTPTADDLAHLEGDTARKLWPHLQNPNDPIRQRIIMERAVIRRAATDLLAAGFTLRVSYGGDEYGTERTTDLGAIMAAIGACDEEWLLALRPSDTSRTGYQLQGTVYLVYGNDGWDVIADNAVSLEDALQGATKLGAELADAA